MRIPKDPQAKLDYVVNWAAVDSLGNKWMIEGDAITASTWSIAPSGLTKVSDSHDDTAATIWLSGGTVGVTYSVTNHIVTAQGREDDHTFTVVIKDTATGFAGAGSSPGGGASSPGGGATAFETAHIRVVGGGVSDNTLVPASSVIADPDYDLPSWISVAGNVVTFEEGGLISAAGHGHVVANFPTTTPGDPDGYASFYIDCFCSDLNPGSAFFGTDYYLDGAQGPDIVGETVPFMVAPAYIPTGAQIRFKAHGDAAESDGSTSIEDATFEVSANFTFTRVLTYPDAPTWA